MRQSNYLFSKGSIVFVKFDPASPNAYLNGRPLIVVSNPTHIMHTLIVCTTGTQDKPGIEVSFYNHFDNSYVGGNPVSNIYPYNLLTIHTNQICSTIGQLDPYVMMELDKAIDFHLGRSMEVPGYMKCVTHELTGVTHNPIQGDKVSDEWVASECTMQVPYKKERWSTREDPVNNKPVVENTRDIDEIAAIVAPIDADRIEDWITEPISKDIDFEDISKNPSNAMRQIDEESFALIISRAVSLTHMCKRYSINKYTATIARAVFTNFAVKIAKGVVTGDPQVSQISGTDIPEYVIIGMVILREFSSNTSYNFSKYSKQIEDIIIKYNLDMSNGRTWRSVEIFQNEK